MAAEQEFGVKIPDADAGAARHGRLANAGLPYFTP
jgi:acyl carrier protein